METHLIQLSFDVKDRIVEEVGVDSTSGFLQIITVSDSSDHSLFELFFFFSSLLRDALTTRHPHTLSQLYQNDSMHRQMEHTVHGVLWEAAWERSHTAVCLPSSRTDSIP